MSTVFADKIKKAVEMNATDGRVKTLFIKQISLIYGTGITMR